MMEENSRINPACVCPYLPCPVHGNCMACTAKSRKEGDLPNCLEEVAEQCYAAQLPRKFPQHTVIMDDYDAMSLRTAEEIAACVRERPDALLCLAAGSSAIRTYEFLKEMQEKGEIDLSRARFVQLDEWLDLTDRSENCQHFLIRHFYGPLGIRDAQIRAFDIDAEDLDAECAAIDRYIEEAGNIDLMLLGIGMNGHVALNEPDALFDHGTHVVELSETTKTVGQKYFSEGAPLTRGMTLGMRQVFQAKEVILQAGTLKKADIIARLYHERPGIRMPASVMALIENGLVILDRDAASKIDPEIVKQFQ